MPQTLVIDANIVLSALLGGAARAIIFSGRFSRYSTQRTLFEVERYLPRLTEKLKQAEQDVLRAFELLPIIACQPSAYDSHMERAYLLIGGRDPKDTDVLALGLKLNCPIWTEDEDFEGIQDVPIVRTSSLVAMLQSGSKQEETSEFSLGGSPQGRPADHLSRRVTDIAVKGVKRGRARRGLSCPNEVTVCAHRREADGTMCLVNVLVAKTRQSAKRWPSPRSWA
ncbi:MAG: PIN domain-containing protein [Rhodopirellula sp.]|nr:PIN domain-containing protein [Rhodopirellula sp.]